MGRRLRRKRRLERVGVPVVSVRDRLDAIAVWQAIRLEVLATPAAPTGLHAPPRPGRPA